MITSIAVKQAQQKEIQKAAFFLAMHNWLNKKGFKKAARAAYEQYCHYLETARLLTDVLEEDSDWTLTGIIDREAKKKIQGGM